MSLLRTLRDWALGLGAMLVVLAVALFTGRWQGREAARRAQEAKNARQGAADARMRAEIDAKNAALPGAPPQRVGDADPETAAGRLRDDGWVR